MGNVMAGVGAGLQQLAVGLSQMQAQERQDERYKDEKARADAAEKRADERMQIQREELDMQRKRAKLNLERDKMLMNQQQAMKLIQLGTPESIAKGINLMYGDSAYIEPDNANTAKTGVQHFTLYGEVQKNEDGDPIVDEKTGKPVRHIIGSTTDIYKDNTGFNKFVLSIFDPKDVMLATYRNALAGKQQKAQWKHDEQVFEDSGKKAQIAQQTATDKARERKYIADAKAAEVIAKKKAAPKPLAEKDKYPYKVNGVERYANPQEISVAKVTVANQNKGGVPADIDSVLVIKGLPSSAKKKGDLTKRAFFQAIKDVARGKQDEQVVIRNITKYGIDADYMRALIDKERRHVEDHDADSESWLSRFFTSDSRSVSPGGVGQFRQ